MTDDLRNLTSPASRLRSRLPSPGLGRGWGRGQTIAGGIIVIIVIALFGVFFLNSKNKNAKIIGIGNSKIRVEIADDLTEQIQGLSGRESLCETCGMLFVYDEPQILTFWMKGMRFALDIIFIRDGKMVEIFENVPPPSKTNETVKTVKNSLPADMVLEVNAGFSEANGLMSGDQMVLQ